MFKRSSTAAVLACLLALAGCGVTSTHHTKPPVRQLVKPVRIAPPCPPGGSFMGCSQSPVAPAQLGAQRGAARATAPLAAAVAHGMFPDVYEGQGAVDWSAVKGWQLSHGWVPAGIFKLGEFRLDREAIRSNALLRALGMWRAGYWFVRNTGCRSEASQIISSARAFGLRVIVNDIEVPEAAPYAGCLVPAERAAGLVPVIYTAPGTWPGGSGFGSAPLWQATYGSSFTAFWHPVVAWQCTDGAVGCVTFVPGVGRDDVSVNLGITSLGAPPPPPPDPYKIYPRTVFSLPFAQHASEHNTVATWDRARCRNPARRAVCKSTRYHLRLLRDRAVFIAHHKPVGGKWVSVRTPRWGFSNLGARVQGIERRLTA